MLRLAALSFLLCLFRESGVQGHEIGGYDPTVEPSNCDSEAASPFSDGLAI